MTPSWTKDAIFYHIYPLGLCGAPQVNDLHQPAVQRVLDIVQKRLHVERNGTPTGIGGDVSCKMTDER